MILNVIIAIMAVVASTGFLSWAIMWGVHSSVSEDLSVRRRFRLVEVLASLGLAAFYAARAQSPREEKLAVLVLVVIIGAWAVRGARSLLANRKA